MNIDPALPAVVIDRFEVEMPSYGPRSRTIREQHPVIELVEQLRRRYDAAIGGYRRFSPRRDSRVERRVERSVEDVLDSIALRFEYDPIEHEYRTPIRLRLGWSWPRLPMWLTVSEASRRHTTVSVRLRSRKRWRYPARYFPAAHDFLRTGRWDSGSPPGPARA